MEELTAEVDHLLLSLSNAAATLEPRASLQGEQWDSLQAHVAELD
jgi:hypothetical protein